MRAIARGIVLPAVVDESLFHFIVRVAMSGKRSLPKAEEARKRLERARGCVWSWANCQLYSSSGITEMKRP